MVEISKLCEPPYNCLPCSELLMHKGLTCKQLFCWNWYRCSMGCLKYFLPLAIVSAHLVFKVFLYNRVYVYLQSPLVLRQQSLNRQTLLNILRYYLETSLWGSTSSAFTFYCICLFRWLYLRFLVFEIIKKFPFFKCRSNRRRLLGRYYLLTATFLPAYTAFQLSWFFPIRTVRLFSTATTQAVRCWQKKT